MLEWVGVLREIGQECLKRRRMRRRRLHVYSTYPRRPQGDLFGRDWQDSTGAATMAGALVESCQFVALKSPWGRLGSVLYTCKRLRRMHRRFKHFLPISLSKPRRNSMNYLAMASRALREH